MVCINRILRKNMISFHDLIINLVCFCWFCVRWLNFRIYIVCSRIQTNWMNFLDAFFFRYSISFCHIFCTCLCLCVCLCDSGMLIVYELRIKLCSDTLLLLSLLVFLFFSAWKWDMSLIFCKVQCIPYATHACIHAHIIAQIRDGRRKE